jgi:hypothetical protein
MKLENLLYQIKLLLKKKKKKKKRAKKAPKFSLKNLKYARFLYMVFKPKM